MFEENQKGLTKCLALEEGKLFRVVRRDYFGKRHDQGFTSALFFILSLHIIQYVTLYLYSEAAIC